MRIRRFAATSALVIAAMGVTAGTAYAAPALNEQAPAATQQSVGQHTGWNVQRDGGNVTVHTDAGTLGQENGYFTARNAQGGLIAAVPLAYEAGGTVYPVAAHIAGNTATLTPNYHAGTPAASSKYAALHQVDMKSATSGVSSNITLTAAIGGYIGAALGALAGCVGGALVGTAVGGTAVPIFGSAGGPVVGCIGGGVFMASASSAIGTAIGGLIGAGANASTFTQLLNQPATK